MQDLPVSVRRALRRLTRRLAVGLFLEVWPAWAVAGLLVAGTSVLIARLFFPPLAPYLPWFWLMPVVAALPALVLCLRRVYRPAQVLALADSLAGGDGLLLALSERPDAAWSEAQALQRIATLRLPSVRPWHQLRLVPVSMLFFVVALLIPQRTLPRAGDNAVAANVVADVRASVEAMKKEALLTPEEEKKLDQEIERIRQGAARRVDAASWEAADSMQQKMEAGLAAKQDAVKWAQQSLARYGAAAQAGGSAAGAAASSPASDAAELQKALSRLAAAGLLNGAPQAISDLAAGRTKLPADPAALAGLQATLGRFLTDRESRLGAAVAAAKAGRFDASDFPTGDPGPDGDGEPGRGAANRGRADAELTRGPATAPYDRFKAKPLPPGAVRSADDWAPIAVLPGAPGIAPQASTSAAAQTYASAAGQEAWRRTLAPRHQSAVKKYFGTGH
jgi:hypothetical protein